VFVETPHEVEKKAGKLEQSHGLPSAVHAFTELEREFADVPVN
jgi:hypothetical protein